MSDVSDHCCYIDALVLHHLQFLFGYLDIIDEIEKLEVMCEVYTIKNGRPRVVSQRICCWKTCNTWNLCGKRTCFDFKWDSSKKE